MKILLDTCVWGGVKQALMQPGYDVKQVGDFKEDPGDKEIIKIAYQEKRVFITLDKDFGELAVVHGEKHHGIIRLVNFSEKQQGRICIKVLNKYEDELTKGAIITVDQKKVRIRL